MSALTPEALAAIEAEEVHELAAILYTEGCWCGECDYGNDSYGDCQGCVHTCTLIAKAVRRAGYEKHGPAERRVPVQRGAEKPSGSIEWSEHVEAWGAYGKKYPGQSAERIAERGGFSYGELLAFLGHEPVSWMPGRVGVTR